MRDAADACPEHGGTAFKDLYIIMVSFLVDQWNPLLEGLPNATK